MKIGFIGAGKMALALARGMVGAQVVAPQEIIASARSAASQARFLAAFSSFPAHPAWTTSNTEVIARAETIVLGLKPQMLPEEAPRLAEAINAAGPRLIISIAAGTSLDSLRKWLGPNARVVRSMPNTPVLVGQGATAYVGAPEATETDLELAGRYLGAGGKAWRVEREEWMNAITALSGSGPAYVFYFAEALAEAGVQQGLPRPFALELAVQTLLGAAAMMQPGPPGSAPALPPLELANQVKSPNGTTVAGCTVLEEQGFFRLIQSAVAAARRRADELGRPA
ncbi:pyrroline-5-carboxylate reductase [Verrucomicrobia bacterium LW23]|nr:pyrroline-5-carboxylate reductase [Verrucomicrobia bacterium LW23]